MRRTFLGEPRPETIAEIARVMAEVDLDPADAQAEIFDGREDPAPFDGWTAEISDAVTGDPLIFTCGFPDRDTLIRDLEGLGIALFIEP